MPLLFSSCRCRQEASRECFQSAPARGEPTRHGFLTNYPPFRRWRPESLDSFSRQSRSISTFTRPTACGAAPTVLQSADAGREPEGRIDRYVAALCREIELASSASTSPISRCAPFTSAAARRRSSRRDNLSRIFEALHRHLRIVDPRSLSRPSPSR